MTLEHQKLRTTGLDRCLKVTNIRNKEERVKSCGNQSCLPGSTLRFCQGQRSRPEVPKWAVQSTGSARGFALLHKDSVISQGPEPMARLKGRALDYKRKGQDWLGTLVLPFPLSKYHRDSVSLSQKGRGGAGCLECSLPPPSPLGPCIGLILQTL